MTKYFIGVSIYGNVCTYKYSHAVYIVAFALHFWCELHNPIAMVIIGAVLCEAETKDIILGSNCNDKCTISSAAYQERTSMNL
jgi:hypothetical protein